MDVVVNASFSGRACLAGKIFYLKIFIDKKSGSVKIVYTVYRRKPPLPSAPISILNPSHEGFVVRPPPGGEALSRTPGTGSAGIRGPLGDAGGSTKRPVERGGNCVERNRQRAGGGSERSFGESPREPGSPVDGAASRRSPPPR